MNSGVYQIECRGKRYIGSTKDFSLRWKAHRYELSRGRHGNPLLQNLWNKYGSEAFGFSIIEACEIKDLLVIEQRYLDQLRPELNIALFASAHMRGRKRSAESIAKQVASITGKKLSQLTRLRISASNTGKKRSQETRAKLSELAKKRTHSPEHMAMMAACVSGKAQTPEHVEKRARARRGLRHPAVGIAKITAARRARPLNLSACTELQATALQALTEEGAITLDGWATLRSELLLPGARIAQLSRKYGLNHSILSRLRSGLHWSCRIATD